MAVTLGLVVGLVGLVAAGPFEDEAATYAVAAAAYGRGDYATALRLWRPLANQGNAAAQYYLGTMYGNGLGVPVDSAASKSWWRKAADGGYAEAQMMLGRLYENGLAVPLDYSTAMSWWRRAADQGYAEAQYHLGFMYQYGMGVPQDYSAAARWYRMAANQGNAHWRIMAQKNLDTMANAPPPALENRNGAAHGQAANTFTGSGVVIGSRGEILTNSHVVEGCERINVRLSSKSSQTAVLRVLAVHRNLSLI